MPVYKFLEVEALALRDFLKILRREQDPLQRDRKQGGEFILRRVEMSEYASRVKKQTQ